jgi:hypothetical protein
MTLKATLNESADLIRLLRVHAPQVSAIAREANKILDKGGAFSGEVTAAQIQDKLRIAFSEGKLGDLNSRELRQMPRGLFDGPHPIANDVPLRESVLRMIGHRRQKSAVLAAVFQYLEWFDPHSEPLRQVGEWLDEAVRAWPWAWNDRATQYRLFVVSEAPLRLAEVILNNSVTVDRTLEDIGLTETSTTGALVESSFAAACLLVSRSEPGKTVALQERLMAWAKRGTSFGYEKLFPLYVSALLDPWAASEPTEEHRRKIIGVLEEYAGDPRVQPAKWNIVKDRAPGAYAVLLRWLTKASVYQFFDIVDRVADQNMWSYRRAFWTSYLEAGHIEQAWVVFGANGQRIARQSAKEYGDKGLMYFGKLMRGGGRSPDHAALAMKIGDLTIAEWSHSGKYNIWKKRDRGAPKLYQEFYESDELRHAPTDGSHTNSENFGWQRTVAGIIKDETGRSTLASEWKPNKRRR